MIHRFRRRCISDASFVASGVEWTDILSLIFDEEEISESLSGWMGMYGGHLLKSGGYE